MQTVQSQQRRVLQIIIRQQSTCRPSKSPSLSQSFVTEEVLLLLLARSTKAVLLIVLSMSVKSANSSGVTSG